MLYDRLDEKSIHEYFKVKKQRIKNILMIHFIILSSLLFFITILIFIYEKIPALNFFLCLCTTMWEVIIDGFNFMRI